jgi:regulator of sigma E protease
MKHYGLVSSARLAASEVGFVVARTGAYVKGMIAGQEPTDQLSGPIGIAEMSGAMAKAGAAALFDLAAILSISVGMLNLLPIPLLDGGHLLYYAIEALRGKPLNARTQQIGFKVGFALVTSLVAFATYNDILHLTRRWMHWG